VATSRPSNRSDAVLRAIQGFIDASAARGRHVPART
jgi:hypothetical protein